MIFGNSVDNDHPLKREFYNGASSGKDGNLFPGLLNKKKIDHEALGLRGQFNLPDPDARGETDLKILGIFIS